LSIRPNGRKENGNMATFIHDGNSIDYAPAADAAAGAVVVQGDLIGVTRAPIAANTLGSLAVNGVFDFPKALDVGTAIPIGATCYWDVADGEATMDAEGGANKLIGKCVKAAADADTTVRIRLSQ
jgi:predicted RecA/RadA family phage recombinase